MEVAGPGRTVVPLRGTPLTRRSSESLTMTLSIDEALKARKLVTNKERYSAATIMILSSSALSAGSSVSPAG